MTRERRSCSRSPACRPSAWPGAFNRAAGTFAVAEAQATRDRLTGIPNRESLLRTLGGEVERANRHSKPLSVAFMDIDRFKSINDSHGHRIGDAVLQQVAGLITRSIRASDIFGRYGGEEFMLILPETTPEDAFVLVEELREMVMRHYSAWRRDPGRRHDQHRRGRGHSSELQVDRLVDAADAAMYVAKSEGRNRSFLFGSVTDESIVRARHHARATGCRGGHRSMGAPAPPRRWHRSSHRNRTTGRPSDMIAALSIGVGFHMGLSRVEMDRIASPPCSTTSELALPGEILDKPPR